MSGKAGEAEEPESFEIRPFRQEDILRCGQLATEAWPIAIEFGSKEHGREGLQGYVEMSLGYATIAEVVTQSGEVIGFLFGKIVGQPKLDVGGEYGDSWPSLIAKSLSGEYGKVGIAGRALWSFIMTELKLALNRPRSDAEIIMLIVDSRSRGLGVGKMLVDRFMVAAKSAGCVSMTVYTDDQQSNWGFYERYGFKRVATFHDNTSTYFIGRKTNGIIYVLDLREWAQSGFGSRR